MIPMTPSGTRSLRMCKPLGRVHSASVSPTGSARPTTSLTAPTMSFTRAGVSRRRSRIAPSRPELSTSARFAARISFSRVSMASAIEVKSAFFAPVVSAANFADAPRARSNFSWVEAAVVAMPGINSSNFTALGLARGREVGPDLSLQPQSNGPRMSSIHDGDVNPRFTGEFGGTKLGKHTAPAEWAFPLTQTLQLGGNFADHALQPRFPAPVGDEKAIYIGQQQQPVCLCRCG